MKKELILPIGLACGILATVSAAENWPAWRGPSGNGAAAHTPPPLDLEGKLLWKTELPGRGCSTPIVWDGRIFLTSPIGEKDGLLAFDSTGKELWRVEVGDLVPGRGQRIGSAANSSPITDGKIVVSYFKSGNVAATDLDGKLLWHINLPAKYGKDTLWWDQGTSPVFAGGKIVIAVMQTEGDSYLVSLDPKTGGEVWKTDRKYPAAPESGDAYTTPHVVTVDGKEQIVSWGGRHVTAHDAETGELIWECGDFIPAEDKNQRVIASAAVGQELAVVPFNRGDGLGAIRLGGSGDVTDSAWLWKNQKLGADSVTPVLHDGKVYVLKDAGPQRGRITCLDAKSGEKIWESKLPKAVQVYYSSPVIIGDQFLAVREDGNVISARISKDGLSDFSETALEENVIASPACFDGKVLVRGDKHLFCLGR